MKDRLRLIVVINGLLAWSLSLWRALACEVLPVSDTDND
jgi:hypothetical protein